MEYLIKLFNYQESQRKQQEWKLYNATQYLINEYLRSEEMGKRNLVFGQLGYSPCLNCTSKNGDCIYTCRKYIQYKEKAYKLVEEAKERKRLKEMQNEGRNHQEIEIQ